MLIGETLVELRNGPHDIDSGSQGTRAYWVRRGSTLMVFVLEQPPPYVFLRGCQRGEGRPRGNERGRRHVQVFAEVEGVISWSLGGIGRP